MSNASDIILVARGNQDSGILEDYSFLQNKLNYNIKKKNFEKNESKIGKNIKEQKKIDKDTNESFQELINSGNKVIEEQNNQIKKEFQADLNKLENIINQKSITLFKKIYKRHTAYTKSMVEILPNETPHFNQKVNFIIKPHIGHMLGDLVLKIELPKLTFIGGSKIGKYTNKIGLALIERVSFYIGETLIERQTGQFMDVYNQLNMNTSQKNSYNILIGNIATLNYDTTDNTEKYLLLIPLRFWFCKDIGQALPLVAMQSYNDPNKPIRVEVKIRDDSRLVHIYDSNTTYKIDNFSNFSLLANVYFLNDKEKDIMSKTNHKLLITQTQMFEQHLKDGGKNYITLPIQNDIKELIWVGQRLDTIRPLHSISNGIYEYNNHFDYLSYPKTGYNMFSKFSISVSNTDFIEEREPQFFNLLLPLKSHINTPESAVYIYNFSEKPDKFQPSGHFKNKDMKINFSSTLNGEGVGLKKLIFFAVSYNVLNINSPESQGQAKLLYPY